MEKVCGLTGKGSIFGALRPADYVTRRGMRARA